LLTQHRVLFLSIEVDLLNQESQSLVQMILENAYEVCPGDAIQSDHVRQLQNQDSNEIAHVFQVLSKHSTSTNFIFKLKKDGLVCFDSAEPKNELTKGDLKFDSQEFE